MAPVRLQDETGACESGPDAGAQALSLLFGTAGSSCIAHHGPLAKLFPSPPLKGRQRY